MDPPYRLLRFDSTFAGNFPANLTTRFEQGVRHRVSLGFVHRTGRVKLKGYIGRVHRFPNSKRWVGLAPSGSVHEIDLAVGLEDVDESNNRWVDEFLVEVADGHGDLHCRLVGTAAGHEIVVLFDRLEFDSRRTVIFRTVWQ